MTQDLRVAAPVLDMFGDPDGAGPLTSQLLRGEAFELLDPDPGRGLVRGRCATDGYEGFVDSDGLAPAPAPDRRVNTLGTQLYAAPRLKLRPVGWLPYLATVAAAEERDGYARIGPDLWCPLRHLAPLDDEAPDYVAVAERFLGLPYLWGGRSNAGLDCSALVQLALLAAGRVAPRDSHQQESLGTAIPTAMQRGDLVFWRGHVGIMRDAETLLHANAHHMAVVMEPLAAVTARIEDGGGGPVTAVRRL